MAGTAYGTCLNVNINVCICKCWFWHCCIIDTAVILLISVIFVLSFYSSNSISCAVYVPEKNQVNKGSSKPTTNGNKTETDAKKNQEISHQTTLEISQDSNVSTTSEVKGQTTESVKKDDTQCGDEADSTTDAAKDHGSETTESMPVTKSNESAESDNSESQTENVDMPIAPSLPDSSKGAQKEDTPQERMDVDQSSADDLSKSAAKSDDKGDQVLSADQDCSTICNTDAMESEISGTGSSVSADLDNLSTDAKNMTSDFGGHKVTTIVEEEGEKSEDEGVESDLDEDEDETQPLVSPVAEQDKVLREELIKQQREREGYSTLQNEEGTIPELDSIEHELDQGDSPTANTEPSVDVANASDVTPEVDSSVAMETETSSTTNAKIASPQSDETDQKKTSPAEEEPAVTASSDVDDAHAPAEEPESFVDFSSGLFAHNLSGASLVPDITECVHETSKSQEELKVIQAEGIEIRMKSGEDLSVSVERSESQQSASSSDDVKLKSDSEANGLSKVSSATDATATKQMDYDKTNLEGEY